MVECVDDAGRHGFVGVCQKEADLPHFGTAELSLEGGHTREADAILDFPVGLTDWVVTDADDVGILFVLLEKLGSAGIHMGAERRGSGVQSVANGAALDINPRAGGQVRCVGFHVSAGSLFLNASIKRHVHDTALVRKSRV